MTTLQERLGAVRQSIAQAAKGCGRNPQDIELIVVTKNHPVELAIDLVDLGCNQFGENRDQEAAPKAALLAQARPEAQVDWHFVGQLQSNKVRSVLGYASSIHSLDRASLLQALAKETAKLAAAGDPATIEVFIELNLTDDPNRGGIEPKNLLAFAESVLEVPSLVLKGVMGVASLSGSPEADFETIAGASRQLQTVAPAAGFISAGMSADYALAITYGATHVRIGTAITGKRQY
ncbi:MAG: YggS family pyridoxal phosphate-dependent enzyme [Micrococcales bacterium]